MKLLTSVLFAGLAATQATAATFTGNITIVGQGGCSTVPSGPFPIQVFYTDAAAPFYFSILIQNPSASVNLPLDYITVDLTPVSGSGGNATVYDTVLFGSINGLTDTYTGAPFLKADGSLRIGDASDPLILTQTVSNTTTPPCVLKITGTAFPAGT